MKRLYCLKDLKSGAYIMLMLAENSGEYVKAIDKKKLDKPEDYDVYFIGEFDTVTGYLHSFKFPVRNLVEEMRCLLCL